MTEEAKALNTFFSSFGIPAYEENSVPNNAELPYITYQISLPDWNDVASISANVWYSGTSYTTVFSKVDEISERIGQGISIPVGESGYLYLYKDNPFSQVAPTGNDNVKVVYLNIGIHDLT